MSSSILTTIQAQLNLYGNSFFMIVGNIGNVFIVILFSRQRQNTCGIYLISSAVVNIVYLIYKGFVQFFPFNYGDGTMRAVILCKCYPYILGILGQVATTMIVFACIDRFLITSRRVTFRAFSTPKLAKYLILFSFIFWSLFESHYLIMTTIVNGRCGLLRNYSTSFTVLSLISIGLFPPITSSLFGYLTYRNMRQMHNRVQPIGQNTTDANTSIKRRDRDLLILVVSEVFVYVITAALFPLVLLETMISQYAIPNKSVQYSQIESFIVNIGILLLAGNSAAPFYIYLISSKSFRRDFKQLLINTYQKIRRQQPTIPVAFTTNRTVAQQETRV